MLEYAPMLHVSYYAQNYAGIIRQGLTWSRFSGMPITHTCEPVECQLELRTSSVSWEASTRPCVISPADSIQKAYLELNLSHNHENH